MRFTQAPLALALATVALSHPVEEAHIPTSLASLSMRDDAPPAVTVDQLLAIMPTAKSCDGATYADECHTAAQAAPLINAAFVKYGITHPSVKAAIIGTMAYESAELKYNKNHFPAPGRPGQGTKAMMMSTYTAEYAASLGLPTTGDPQTVADRVETTDYTFGAAAWYVTTHCPFAIRQGMWGGQRAGWDAYITSCLGTTSDSDRVEYWQRALKALGTA